VGAVLAARLGWALADSDALHSPAEVAKMHAGVPLTDTDRWPWLGRVAGWIDERIAAGESGVIACSALKHSYRDYLSHGRPAVRIVILHVDPEVLAARLGARQGHFFPARLLQSQLADLELPGDGETTLVADASTRSPAEIADEIIRRLGLAAPPRS
jgi:gluconokinase